MNPTTRHSDRTAPLWLRGAIWCALLVLSVGGYVVSGATATSTSDTLIATVAQGSDELPPEVSLDDALEGVQDAVGGSAFVNCAGNSYCQALAVRYTGEPNDLLPAWRWSGATGLTDTYGIADATNGNRMFSFFAGMLLMVSAWIWWLIIGLLGLVLRLNPLEWDALTERVNGVFYALGSGVSGGLLWIPLVAVLMLSALAPMRGKGSARPGAMVVMLGLPLGMLWGMMTASAPNSSQTAPEQVGSPIWLAAQGVELVDETTGLVVNAMSAALSEVQFGGMDPDVALRPNCGEYTNVLKSAFLSAWNNGDRSGGATMVTFSNLWEAAYLSQWSSAQYGSSSAAGRLYCHQMDREIGISPVEQAKIGAAAGWPAVAVQDTGLGVSGSGNTRVIEQNNGHSRPGEEMTWWELQYEGGVGGEAQWVTVAVLNRAPTEGEFDEMGSVLGPYTWSHLPARIPTSEANSQNANLGKTLSAVDEKTRQQGLLMWGGCGLTTTGRANVGQLKALDSWSEFGDLTDEHCQQWWQYGLPPDGKLRWDEDTLYDAVGGWNVGRGAGVVQVGQALRNFPGATDADANVRDIADMVLAMHGKNAAQRMFAGIFALITAIIYAYVLLLLSAGLLVAKVGLIVMMALLPLTLLLLAMPKWRVDYKTAQRNAIGLNLLKRTVAFAATSGVLQALLLVLILVIGLIRSILSNVPLFALADAAAPIISLLLVKKIASAAGVGSITSPAGALGMAAAAAAGTNAMLNGQKGGFKKAASSAGESMRGMPSKMLRDAKDLKTRSSNRLDQFAKTDKSGLAGKARGLAALAGRSIPEKSPGGPPSMDDTKRAADDLAHLANGKSDRADAEHMSSNAAAAAQVADKDTVEKRRTRAERADRVLADQLAAIDASNAPDAEKKRLREEAMLAHTQAQADIERAEEFAGRAGMELSEATNGALDAKTAAERIEEGTLPAFVQTNDGVMTSAQAVRDGYMALDKDGNLAATALGQTVGATGVTGGVVAHESGSQMSLSDAVEAGYVTYSDGQPVTTAAGQAAGWSVSGASLGQLALQHDGLQQRHQYAAVATATATRVAASVPSAERNIVPVLGTAGVYVPDTSTGVGCTDLTGSALADPAMMPLLFSNEFAQNAVAAGSDPTTGAIDQRVVGAVMAGAAASLGLSGASPLAVLEHRRDAPDTSPAEAVAIRNILSAAQSGDDARLHTAVATYRTRFGLDGGGPASVAVLNQGQWRAIHGTGAALQRDVEMYQHSVQTNADWTRDAVAGADRIIADEIIAGGASARNGGGPREMAPAALGALVDQLTYAQAGAASAADGSEAAMRFLNTGGAVAVAVAGCEDEGRVNAARSDVKRRLNEAHASGGASAVIQVANEIRNEALQAANQADGRVRDVRDRARFANPATYSGPSGQPAGPAVRRMARTWNTKRPVRVGTP